MIGAKESRGVSICSDAVALIKHHYPKPYPKNTLYDCSRRAAKRERTTIYFDHGSEEGDGE